MDGRLVPREGDAVVSDGFPVGRVTSARWSGLLGRTIGMAWVPTRSASDGSVIRIRSAGQLHEARVTTRPFYDPEGRRLRV
jgi:aminomethyltransferase